MQDRLRKLRKEQGLSQIEFAEKIGRSRSAVLTWEGGTAKPDAASISLICQEFRVNPRWLKTGTGEMHIPEAEDDELIDDVLRDADDVTRACIRGIARTPGGWELMRQLILNIQEELEKEGKRMK